MQKIEHRGCRLAFRVVGSRTPVIFIQGASTSGDGWQAQTTVLATNHACLSLDKGVGAQRPRP